MWNGGLVGVELTGAPAPLISPLFPEQPSRAGPEPEAEAAAAHRNRPQISGGEDKMPGQSDKGEQDDVSSG